VGRVSAAKLGEALRPEKAAIRLEERIALQTNCLLLNIPGV
jgi:hypothetical protein